MRYLPHQQLKLLDFLQDDHIFQNFQTQPTQVSFRPVSPPWRGFSTKRTPNTAVKLKTFRDMQDLDFWRLTWRWLEFASPGCGLGEYFFGIWSATWDLLLFKKSWQDSSRKIFSGWWVFISFWSCIFVQRKTKTSDEEEKKTTDVD